MPKISSASVESPPEICTSSGQHLPRTSPTSVHFRFFPKRSPQTLPGNLAKVSNLCPASVPCLPRICPRFCQHLPQHPHQHLPQHLPASVQELPSTCPRPKTCPGADRDLLSICPGASETGPQNQAACLVVFGRASHGLDHVSK